MSPAEPLCVVEPPLPAQRPSWGEDLPPLEWQEVGLGGRTIRLPELADPLAYLEKRLARGFRVANDLPLWTKLWPGSLMLAQLVEAMQPPVQSPVLELGAGVGLPGLVAAQKGCRVILTDNDPDALCLARLAVEANGLGHLVEVRELDWLTPPSDLAPVATILGAEVLYERAIYPDLARLVARLLLPGGRALFSYQERPFRISFFDHLGEEFSLGRLTRRLRGDDEEPPAVFHLVAATRRRDEAGPQ
ncbi:MAG: methyltransferase [Deltaproteobacteria bacterium]|nr:methyltransferase [Deltaproteobacteria bacterium]